MQIPNRPTLWRLYTDTTFRKEFIFDKERFYHKYDVPVDIIDWLEDTPIDELTFFADVLLKKRMSRVKNLLPSTFQLMGKDIQVHFLKFCDRHTITGIRRHQEDAVHFVQYLLNLKALSASQKNYRYVKAVLKFEQQQVMNRTLPDPVADSGGPVFMPIHRSVSKHKKRFKKPVQQFSVNEDWLHSTRRKRERKTERRQYPILFL